ncbi:MAG: SRPBCC family protein [Cyanobacteria bacterium J06598_3]
MHSAMRPISRFFSALSFGLAERSPEATEPQSPSQQRSQGLWGSPGTRESNYWAESSAPADTLWQMVSNLTNLANWHPIITATNAPLGQRAKPGLIYKAFSRYIPLSTSIFVERVLPGELVSIRLFPLPGVQERVTYRIVSTLCGTCVLYSMTLSGWLSPLVWPMLKPQATRVAVALVQAAENVEPQGGEAIYRKPVQADIFG